MQKWVSLLVPQQSPLIASHPPKFVRHGSDKVKYIYQADMSVNVQELCYGILTFVYIGNRSDGQVS